MLGLEYMSRVFSYSFTDIAKKIGVTPQYIQSGVRLDKEGNPRRKFSPNILNKLEEVFGLPDSYYQKELSRVEEIDVQLMYLAGADGGEYTEEFAQLQKEQLIYNLLEDTENYIKNEYEYYQESLQNFNTIFFFKGKRRIQALSSLLNLLTNDIKGHMNHDKKDDFTKELELLLIKHNVMNDLKAIPSDKESLFEVLEPIETKED